MTESANGSRHPEVPGEGADAATLRGAVDVAVVGAGVSGLTAAYETIRLRPDLEVAVLEASDRPGGTMLTDRVAGCLGEWGPNGFLTNVPNTWDLAVELGLEDRLLPADESAELRYLWVNGGLRALPMSPPAFFTSDVLSLKGRLRVLLEPFQGKGPEDDETVFSFASRRIGREAASVLVDAMVSGIYAGDPANLSLKAAFPKMRNMEREYGSLVKAMIAKKREARRNKTAGGGPMGPGGRLTSFDEGMEVLIKALVKELGPRLRTGVSATGLEPVPGGGYRLRYTGPDGPGELAAGQVVMATPSFAAEAVLKEHFPRVAWPLNEIPYAGITVACLVYERQQVHHSLEGFGFIVPRGQGPRLLGCIWTGSIFPPHVTGNRVLLRTMLGGARDPEAAMLSEGRTVDLVHGELDRMLGGIQGRPVETALFRHAKGIPQYVPGHPDRLETLDRHLAEHPGLHLAGNAYRGIGVNDCVREARALAARIAGAAGNEAEAPPREEARR